ncbi:MAG: acetylxylan esterase [Verrucomicrobiales bacterium]|nr:acetylxylan esterase [Verrucomicrobiales bacterium]
MNRTILFTTWLMMAVSAPAPAEELRSLDGSYFPMDAAGWQRDAAARRSEVRDRVMLAAGIFPMPEKTPLNAVIHGRVEREDYTIDRVFFESLPGHYVTGNLYLPKPLPASMPGILCPHGHWPGGRFMDAGESTGSRSVETQIASGAERFPNAARSPLQARCVHLARMGCAVFHWDTLGNADSIQIPDHRSGAQEGLKGQERGTWGLYSAQADAHLQTNFGLQTWNSVRALDFLETVPGVDPQRLAVTGASGGATQTMMLAAIEDRICAAFPCVMVSTAMQGGCTCENTHFLRIGQGNVDIAAAIAPRPLGLTSADDWTKELETKGWPDLQALWRQLGAENNLTALFATQFPHNYNQVARAKMYHFMNQHLKLGLEEADLVERDFKFSPKEDLTVWTAEHPAPTGDAVGKPHEAQLMQVWADLNARAMTPEIQCRAWRLMASGDKTVDQGREVKQTGSNPTTLSLGELEPAAENIRLPMKKEAPDDAWNAWCGYTYGYNRPRLLRWASMLADAARKVEGKVILQGQGADAAAAGLAALLLDPEKIERLEVDPQGFRFADLTSQWHPAFVPGAVKYGDVEALKNAN